MSFNVRCITRSSHDPCPRRPFCCRSIRSVVADSKWLSWGHTAWARPRSVSTSRPSSSDSILGVDIVKEVARRCPLPINEDTTFDAQAWILHTQIAEEIEAASHYEVVVCDRSVLDNYASSRGPCGRRAELEPLVREWVRSYQALFKVPVLSAPAFDGKRAVSPSFQQEIDGIIDELVHELGVTVHRLSPASAINGPCTHSGNSDCRHNRRRSICSRCGSRPAIHEMIRGTTGETISGWCGTSSPPARRTSLRRLPGCA